MVSPRCQAPALIFFSGAARRVALCGAGRLAAATRGGGPRRRGASRKRTREQAVAEIAYRSPAERLVASQALLHVYRQYGQRPAITSATARKRERPAFW